MGRSAYRAPGERLGERKKYSASEGVFKGELREAREKIAKLESQPRIGEEAQTKIDNLTQELQQANQRVLAAGERVTELERQALPRRITDVQKERLMNVLRVSPPLLESRYRVKFFTIAGCSECAAYTNELAKTWEKVKSWEVTGTVDFTLDPSALSN